MSLRFAAWLKVVKEKTIEACRLVYVRREPALKSRPWPKLDGVWLSRCADSSINI